MRKGDQQLGAPQILYKDTKANIEALTGVLEGAIAYATDTDEPGFYNGSIWQWGAGGGWTSVFGSYTRTGNYTFTVTGDLTSIFYKGAKLQFTDTTTKYGVVKSATYAAPTTTVTLITNDDYLLVGNPTNMQYSYIENPQGFPQTFNWTPSGTGYSAVTTAKGRWNVQGRIAWIEFQFTVTSNASTFTITNCPVANNWTQTFSSVLSTTTDAGTLQTTPGRLTIASGGSTIVLRSDTATGAWTNTGTKTAVAIFVMEF